ncbi:uncharacterized protein SCODWIG_03474 [Saccharomycodes ludwigii]|uniref:Uncharacterized protein n=1 Tax=Saccharomycodes ludwigii TaxID=36035 RepID=A0A376BAJ9_9ASCO|nr:uncharacterized protein SCODWIG_03474 [Saccharomycodes ludwigii]
MDLFFNQINKGSTNLSKILSIDLQTNGKLIAILQNSLNTPAFNSTKLCDVIEERLNNQLLSTSTRFKLLIESFLNYCSKVDPWSIWNNIDLIFQYYQDLTNLVSSFVTISDLPNVISLNIQLCELFRSMTLFIIPISLKVDAVYSTSVSTTNKNDYIFTTQLTLFLAKFFQSIKPLNNRLNEKERNPKNELLLWVVNRLNNLYIKIGSSSSCNNIFQNISHKIGNDVAGIKSIHKFDVLEYRFILGRFYLMQNKLTKAFYHLNQTYTELSCLYEFYHFQQFYINIEKVLKYLLPLGLVLGKIPKLQTPIINNNPHLAEYQNLAKITMSGDLSLFNEWMTRNQDILLKENVYILLLDKLPLIILRNCIKNIFQITTYPASNKISYEVISRGLQYSCRDFAFGGVSKNSLTLMFQDLDIFNVENVLITLITYNLLKGNCFPMNKVMVTMKNVSINEIFPPINEKILVKFPVANGDEKDSWLYQL